MVFLLPITETDLPQPQFSCMFDCITFHFYWVYGYKRSQRHIFMEEYDFLPHNYIPLRKTFFSCYCLHKIFQIYLTAVIVCKLFKATAYLIFIDWDSFIIINLFLLNEVAICRTCPVFLPIKYHSIAVNFFHIPLSIPHSHMRFLLWYL